MPVPIRRHSEIDVTKLKIAPPTQNKNGGLNANLLYEDQRLVFRTPKMACPFGIGSFTEKDGRGATKYSLDLSFRGMEHNADIQGFYEFMKAIDNLVVTAAHANSECWFNKKMDAAVLKELYTSSIRESSPKPGKDGVPIRYPPTFRGKVVYGMNAYNSEAYDTKNMPIDILSIGKGDQAVALVEVTGIYFLARRSFGVSFKIVQAMVFPSTRMVGCMIQLTEDEADGTQETPTGVPLLDASPEDLADDMRD